MGDSYRHIRTIEDAKQFFWDFDCRHFHMDREAPSSYRQYCSLGVSKEQEQAWSKELFSLRREKLEHTNIDESSFLDQFRALARLAEVNPTLLPRMYEISEMILTNGSAYDCLVASEVIVEKATDSHRNGLAFVCFDSKQKKLSKQFIKLSIQLSKRAMIPECGLESLKITHLAKDALREAESAYALLFRYSLFP